MKKDKQSTTFRPTRPVKQGSRYQYTAAKPVAVADSVRKKTRPVRHAVPFLVLWLPLTLLVAVGFFLTRPAQSELALSSPTQVSPTSAITQQNRLAVKIPVTIPLLSTFTPKPAPQPTDTPLPAPTPRQSLQEVVNQVIAQYKDGLGKQAEFSLFIQNIDTGERYEINSQQLFETGSVYKLFVMLTVLHDISQNKFDLDTLVTLTPDIPKYTLDEDGGVLIVPIGGSKTVRDLLYAMITHSNNTAALMLLGKVHTAHMSELVASFGLAGSDLTDSFNFRTTAADLNVFLTKLANHQLLGQPYDEQMLDLLSNQQFRSKIPGLLPSDTKIANKVGDFPGVSNDTGIVYLPNGQRISITILIHETNVEGARDFISQVSLTTYNYFSQNKANP